MNRDARLMAYRDVFDRPANLSPARAMARLRHLLAGPERG
jgi:hypothetical protein